MATTDEEIKDEATKNVEQEIKDSGKTYTEEEVQKLIDEQVNGLKNKVDELLGEKKSATQKAKELEEYQKTQEEERMKEKEQFRELYEREQESKRELQEKYEEFQSKIQKQTINSEATKLASELTRDTARGELLQEKVSQYAKYSDDGVVFELGGVPVEKDKILSHLREKYPFLVDGSGATGGGAAGTDNGRAVTTQKSFNEMTGGELSELRAENPTEYDRLRNEYYGQR
jgi:hypothetical protein